MAAKRKITKKTLTEALDKANGFVTYAAKILGVSRMAIYKYMEKHPEMKEVYEDIKNKKLDIAEFKLIENIKAGDTTSLIFFLKCQGKQRGYTEKSHLDITTGGEKINTIRLVEVIRDNEGT